MPLAAHNDKEKPLGNNGLPRSGAYFNIEEKIRQYFSCLLIAFRFVYLILYLAAIRASFRCFFGVDNCNIRKAMMREL